MKKLMTLMLGLALGIGSVAVYAQEAAPQEGQTKGKKKGKKKKSAEPKSGGESKAN